MPTIWICKDKNGLTCSVFKGRSNPELGRDGFWHVSNIDDILAYLDYPDVQEILGVKWLRRGSKKKVVTNIKEPNNASRKVKSGS